MEMKALIGYGASETITTLWCEQQGKRLLPLQEQAVRAYGLFGGGNLLVQAPTGSGKTFVGEMAAVHAALQGKKTVYLLPLKALAEEKYRVFRRRYRAYGIRVIICTRDHRDFDGAFERGDFDIAVVVYEKLEHLATARPERVRELSLVVADELEVLSDVERGAAIEALLTRLIIAGVRIIALSAVLGEAAQIALWLKAQLLEYERRPVELRYGVLHEGIFQYRGHNNQEEGEEILLPSHGDTFREEIVNTVRHLAEAGESCLVFVKSRRETRQGAEVLTHHLSLPAAPLAIEKLRDCEATRSRDLLLHTLEISTAFHSADLLPEERRIVEEAFRIGEVKVLVATSTLATGMNLPARNVFMNADKWIYDPCLDLPWRTPISQGEFENMSGRAGRYSEGNAAPDPGRAILTAASFFERDALWQRYVKGMRESVVPQLAQAPLEDHVLRLIVSRTCRTFDGLDNFFAQTLSAARTGEQLPHDEGMRFPVAAAIRRCQAAGMIRILSEDSAAVGLDDTDDFMGLTFDAEPAGRVAAIKGISLRCARVLLHWTRLSEQRNWQPLDLLITLALAPDARLRQIALTQYEYKTRDYPGRLKKQTESLECNRDTPLNRLRKSRIAPLYDEARAVKTALFLNDWIDEIPLQEIEEEYDITAGQIRTAADQLSWLADAAASLADAEEQTVEFADAVRVFAERLRFGVRDELLATARRVPGLARSVLLRFAAAGLGSPEALRNTPLSTLERWMSPAQAQRLKRWAGKEGIKQDDVEEPIPMPLLTVDDTRPGEVELGGHAIALQEKQYRLIRILAMQPGQCVPYAAIYREIWGDVVVEDNQMHYQKRMLIKRLATAGAEYNGIIGTVIKRGFTLKLTPEQVCLRIADPCTAGPY
ncbi:MAG: DEAD/DEAH box helicase [Candidatus Hydrogenedentes bacterium]|nr:DEAD/DEAH box helicase [Candidatus Hydrogenedentota bacterium]